MRVRDRREQGDPRGDRRSLREARHRPSLSCSQDPQRPRASPRVDAREREAGDAAAYESADPELARRQLERLTRSLEREHPGAAGSLREGLEETLTLQRLGVTSALYRSLRSTNAIENLNGSIVQFCHNVRRWQDGAMLLDRLVALRSATRLPSREGLP